MVDTLKLEAPEHTGRTVNRMALARGVAVLTGDNNMPFKYDVDTCDFMQRVIDLVAGEDHGISLGTTTAMGETWIELHCTLPVALRKALRRVFYPQKHGDRNERRAYKRAAEQGRPEHDV